MADKTVQAIQSQLRQELNFSDFHFLARSITDYTKSGAIRCAVLSKSAPENILIVDLRYMERSCLQNTFLLLGDSVDVMLKSLNGDEYHLSLISNNSGFFYSALWGFRVFGVILIYTIFVMLSLRAEKEMLGLKFELEVANRLNEMALQVSHDIRSPLSALRVAIQDSNRTVVEMAILRIENIANNLLERNRENISETVHDEPIIELLESIILEKQAEFQKTKINLIRKFYNFDLVVKVNQQSIKRVISNLINNAQEAFQKGKSGEINIIIDFLDSEKVLIEVQDNGKGIPQSIIAKLGEKGFSYGKEENLNSGSGLGLFHAKQILEKLQGDLVIESQENVGTKISLVLPCKKYVLSELQGSGRALVPMEILVDDDDLVRLMWSSRANKVGANFIAYSRSEEILSNLHLFSAQSIFYIDSELRNEKGEELAQKLSNKGFSNIFLVTGHPKEKFSHLNFIKDVLTKKPPF